MLAADSMTSLRMIRKHILSPNDVTRLTMSANKLVTFPCDIKRSTTITELVNQCRRIKLKTDLCLVVVDYLQLLQPASRERNREREVAEVSQALKFLAMELGLVVVALSQLNDDGYLRESRVIGHDASVIINIHEPDNAGPHDREIIIQKNRDGQRNVVIPIQFIGEFMQFKEV
jgi:replicative DNA helicase